MYCVDVIEELAAPTGPVSAAVAEHLASCARCAAWSRRDARLMQLWETTRPEEPPPVAFESIWANLTAALKVIPATTAPRALARPWLRWAGATLGIAQAAAFLVGAVWLGLQPAPATAAVARVNIPASDGRLVMISSNGADLKFVSLDGDEGSNTVDPSFVMLGKLEAMAE